MSTPSPDPERGSILRALEADLTAWDAGSGVLAQTARLVALQLDSGASDVTSLSRELRQLVKQIREMAQGGHSELDVFLESIQAEGFR